MNRCMECNTDNKDQASFCTRCGQSLAAQEPPEAEPAEELSRLEVARTEKKAREDAEKKEPR